MTTDIIKFMTNVASEIQIKEHLSRCDHYYIPPLSDRVNLSEYSQKIFVNARRFEAWLGEHLIGLVAAYFSEGPHGAVFITNVSIEPQCLRSGIASKLMEMCRSNASAEGRGVISLEVYETNEPAVGFYKKLGFEEVSSNDGLMSMTKNL